MLNRFLLPLKVFLIYFDFSGVKSLQFIFNQSVHKFRAEICKGFPFYFLTKTNMVVFLYLSDNSDFALKKQCKLRQCSLKLMADLTQEYFIFFTNHSHNQVSH